MRKLLELIGNRELKNTISMVFVIDQREKNTYEDNTTTQKTSSPT